MSSLLRPAFSIALCAGFWCTPAPTQAADLAGDWLLNFPDNPTTWTFSQTTATSYTATTGDLSGTQYDIAGVTFGPWYAGILFFTLTDTDAPTIPIGALAGWVDGDSMSGVLASYLLGIVQVDGERPSQPAAPRQPRGR
jgi:hypothetical protein